VHPGVRYNLAFVFALTWSPLVPGQFHCLLHGLGCLPHPIAVEMYVVAKGVLLLVLVEPDERVANLRVVIYAEVRTVFVLVESDEDVVGVGLVSVGYGISC
jgi:hypothetical protein